MSERKTITVNTDPRVPHLKIRCRAYVPAKDYILKSNDARALGILIRSVTYNW